MAVRFGVIFIFGNDSDFREVLLEFSENIPKAPKKKFHFRHQKILHQFLYMDILKEK